MPCIPPRESKCLSPPTGVERSPASVRRGGDDADELRELLRLKLEENQQLVEYVTYLSEKQNGEAATGASEGEAATSEKADLEEAKTVIQALEEKLATRESELLTIRSDAADAASALDAALAARASAEARAESLAADAAAARSAEAALREEVAALRAQTEAEVAAERSSSSEALTRLREELQTAQPSQHDVDRLEEERDSLKMIVNRQRQCLADLSKQQQQQQQPQQQPHRPPLVVPSRCLPPRPPGSPASRFTEHPDVAPPHGDDDGHDWAAHAGGGARSEAPSRGSGADTPGLPAHGSQSQCHSHSESPRLTCYDNASASLSSVPARAGSGSSGSRATSASASVNVSESSDGGVPALSVSPCLNFHPAPSTGRLGLGRLTAAGVGAGGGGRSKSPAAAASATSYGYANRAYQHNQHQQQRRGSGGSTSSGLPSAHSSPMSLPLRAPSGRGVHSSASPSPTHSKRRPAHCAGAYASAPGKSPQISAASAPGGAKRTALSARERAYAPLVFSIDA